MKHALPVMVLLLVMLLPYSIQPVAVAQEPDALDTLETSLFSMQYPAGWHTEIIDVTDGDIAVVYGVISPQPVPGINFDEIIAASGSPSSDSVFAPFIRTRPLIAILAAGATDPDNLEDLQPQEYIEELLEDQDIIATERARPITVNDAAGVETIATIQGQSALSGRVFGVHGISVRTETTFVFAGAGGPVNEYEANRGTFETVLNSFMLHSVPGPALVNNEEAPVPMSDYTGNGYLLEYPADWQSASIETFDGALNVFSPQAVTLTNADFEALLNRRTPPTAGLSQAVQQGPVAGLLVGDRDIIYSRVRGDWVEEPLELLEDLDLFDDARLLALRNVRQVIVNNVLGAELVGGLRGEESLESLNFDVYALVLEVEGRVYLFVGGAPAGQADQLLPIFQHMAYSITVGS